MKEGKGRQSWRQKCSSAKVAEAVNGKHPHHHHHHRQKQHHPLLLLDDQSWPDFWLSIRRRSKKEKKKGQKINPNRAMKPNHHLHLPGSYKSPQSSSLANQCLPSSPVFEGEQQQPVVVFRRPKFVVSSPSVSHYSQTASEHTHQHPSSITHPHPTTTTATMKTTFGLVFAALFVSGKSCSN